MTDIRIGGLQRWSSCDWPGELAATLFCRGCPWSCPFCYNRTLRPAVGEGDIAWDEVLSFLSGRVGLLDGVVFSGGEPLAQSAVFGAMAEVRSLGFRIGMHTGGYAPDRLARALPLVDWVGFDVKAPFVGYDRVTGAAGSGEAVRESLDMLLASGVAYELRTTVDPSVLDDATLAEMAAMLAERGAANWVLQRLRSDEGKIVPSAQLADAAFAAIAAIFPAAALR